MIAENPDVALVHISQDSSEDSAEDWAAENQFPWLTILPGDVKRSDLQEYSGRGVPHYTLRSADGKEIANGLSASLRKIRELPGS